MRHDRSEAPAAPAASQTPADDVTPQGGPVKEAGLAETGGNSLTPYLMGGALALLAAGGGAVVVARRRG
ncbi:LAETG motif-containing sortase-dependent surface protein [Streptomyces canus]|uniref:LAETG motif-containing sortase-dependent surface protein n=1 Tax=Streptomyces canus TaxID=58343 RepID=UPI0036E1CD92